MFSLRDLLGENWPFKKLSVPTPLSPLQYSQAANVVSECEQAEDLGAINSTLR